MAIADELLTTGDAAHEIGVREWQVSRLFERGLLVEPPRVGERRVLRRADLPAVREAAIRAGYLTESPARRPAEAAEVAST
jgi:hypothetical protein